MYGSHSRECRQCKAIVVVVVKENIGEESTVRLTKLGRKSREVNSKAKLVGLASSVDWCVETNKYLCRHRLVEYAEVKWSKRRSKAYEADEKRCMYC